MTTKTCKKCDTEKPASEFVKQRRICKICWNAYHVEYLKSHPSKKKKYNRTRKDLLLQIVNDYKSSNGCAYCKEDEPCCLDFHHINPSDKDLSINALVRKSNESRLMKEIAKCVVLCANCHRKLHAGKIDGLALHQPINGFTQSPQ